MTGAPPSSVTPTSNETRVRVEGISNTSATLLPASPRAPSPLGLPAFNSSARSSSAFSSPRLSSSPVKKSRAMEGGGWYAAVDTSAVEIGVITWNLFHGRDFPPDPALYTWRSRLARMSERNATHVQVNRELIREFAQTLCGARWDVALLQECPPRWSAPLAAACGAERAALAHLAQLAWLRSQRPRPAGTPTCSAPGRAARTSPCSGAWPRTARSTCESWCFAAAPSGARWPSPGSPPASAWRTCTRARAPACATEEVRRAAETAVVLGRGGTADPGRRLQSAPQPDRAVRGAGAALRPRHTDRPRLDRPPPGPGSSRPSSPRPRGRLRPGRWPARASDCASRTTRRWRRGSRSERAFDPPAAGMR